MIELIGVEPESGTRLLLRFSDGTSGVLDFALFADEKAGMAAPLRDPALFARHFIEAGALAWPDGSRLSADFLHQRVGNSGNPHQAESATVTGGIAATAEATAGSTAGNKAQTRGEAILTWAQIVAIFLAGLWGMFTFWEEKIEEPRSAPVNVSVAMDLKKGSDSGGLIALEMKITETNPSTRKVYLLPAVWTAIGYKVARQADETDLPAAPDEPSAIKRARVKHESDLRTAAEATLNGLQTKALERNLKLYDPTYFGTGRVSTDTELNPNETVRTTQVIYVPRDRYDLIEVKMQVPSMQKASGLHVKWVVDDRMLPGVRLYVVDCRKNMVLVRSKEEQAHVIGEYGFAVSETDVQLSMWDPPESGKDPARP